jgi:Tfp pilus assembly protein PilO
VAVATVAVVAVLVLDQFLVSPLFARRTELDDQVQIKRGDWEHNQKLVTDSKRMGKRWAEISSGPLKRDESQSESQMLQNVLEWARGAGMEVPSFKRERVEREKDFVKVTFRATGTGTMNQIGNFLWRIQTASVPVRITDVSITSKKEGTDDLSVQLGIATIYLAADADKDKKDNKPASASAAREMWQ